MSVNVDPFVIPIPQKWLTDPELSATVQYLWKFLYDMWSRTGGGNDAIANLEDSALYDVGIKGAEIAEITKALDDLRIQIALTEPLPVREPIGGSVEYNFGTKPVYDAQFTITDSNITPTSKVLIAPGGSSTGRTADDWQWDGATVGVVPGSGSATCYVTFHPGPIVGTRTFNYTVI